MRTRSAGDKNFLSTILKSGTVTDRVSALTILVQEAPIYSLKQLKDDLLDAMAKKKSRREAILAIDSIRDLMTGGLLPNRKLKYIFIQKRICLHSILIKANLDTFVINR